VAGREWQRLAAHGHALRCKGERDQRLRAVTEPAVGFWLTPSGHKRGASEANTPGPEPPQTTSWIHASGALLAVAGTRKLVRPVIGERRSCARPHSRGLMASRQTVDIREPVPLNPELREVLKDARALLLEAERDINEKDQMIEDLQKAREDLERQVGGFQAERDEAKQELRRCGDTLSQLTQRKKQSLTQSLKQSLELSEGVLEVSGASAGLAQSSGDPCEFSEEDLCKLEERGALAEAARERMRMRLRRREEKMRQEERRLQ